MIAQTAGTNQTTRVLVGNNIIKPKKEVINVAAYCRVSKKIEEQASSIEVQMESYKKIISEHPNWKLAGIYADKGITGTSTKKRVEFNRMIEDCKAGKIDYILAKSISRFARNTLDMLEYTRMLRGLGVSVLFEKERVDTTSVSSEMLLTIYSAFAQEESHSISENQKSAFRASFKMGRPKWTQVYGFEKVDRNDWRINPEEAKVVQRIYDLYRQGYSFKEVADALNKEKIPSPTAESKVWVDNTVRSILTNEKYAGDVLMQKTFVKDHLTHDKISNKDGIIPQYFKPNNHEGCIDRTTFAVVQNIVKMKDTKRGCIQYPYYGFLRCPCCGEPMVRFRASARYGMGWVCGGTGTEVIQEKRSSCKPFIIMDKYVEAIAFEAIRSLDTDGFSEEEAGMVTEIKQMAAKREKVEYYYLEKLVDKIVFTSWNVAEVTWKNGNITSLMIEYDRPTDAPDPHESWVGDEFFINGMHVESRAVRIAQDTIARKNDTSRQVRIIMPDPDDIVQVPIVKNGKKEESRDEDNQGSVAAS